MESLWEYLFIAAVIGFGIFGEIRKQKAKKGQQDVSMPTPATQPINMPKAKPIIPKQETVASHKARKEREAMQHQAITEKETREANAAILTQTTSTNNNQANEGNSEFTINNIEEARRAIIWSEILQRKY